MKIFLSAVTSQFKGCRDALRSDLRAIGCEVFVQEDFQQGPRTLVEWLEELIVNCDRVIALIGSAYGSEALGAVIPPDRASRSYTQWEYFFALGDRLGGRPAGRKDMYVYIATDAFLRAHPVDQPAEMAERQERFVAQARTSGEHWGEFDSIDQLCRRVLRDGWHRERPPVVGHTDLPQLSFAAEIDRFSVGFVGREWFDREVGAWLRDPRGAKVLALVGIPGIGKSAIAARMAAARAGDVAAAYFCSDQNSRTLQPLEFVDSLLFQFSGRLEGFGRAVEAMNPRIRRQDGSTAFRELIVEPLRHLPTPAAARMVVIDSLDEAASRAGESIVDVLLNQMDHLPNWLRVFTTTRPDPRVLRRLGQVESLKIRELLPYEDGNAGDVHAYVAARLREADLVGALGAMTSTVAPLIERMASGSFLCARMVLAALKRGDLSVAELRHLSLQRSALDAADGRVPPGLAAFYARMFRRALADRAWGDETWAILRALAVAVVPLTWTLLHRVSATTAEVLRKRLEVLEPYLRSTGRGTNAEYSLAHATLRQWITDPDAAGDAWCEPESCHALLADTLRHDANWRSDPYASRYLPAHLIGAQRWRAAADVYGDLDTFQRLWDANEFEVRAAWVRIERSSAIRLIDVYRSVIDDPIRHLASLRRVAWLLEDTDHKVEAEQLHQVLVAHHRQSGNLDELQISLGNLGLLLQYRGVYDDALRHHREQEDICRIGLAERPAGSLQTGLWKSLNNQGLIRLSQRDEPGRIGAVKLWQEVIHICNDLGDREGLMHGSRNVAHVQLLYGRLEAALRLFRRAESHCRAMDKSDQLGFVLEPIARILELRNLFAAALGVTWEFAQFSRELGKEHDVASAAAAQARLEIALADAGRICPDVKPVPSPVQSERDIVQFCSSVCDQAKCLYAVGDVGRGDEWVAAAIAAAVCDDIDRSRGHPRRRFIRAYVGAGIDTQVTCLRYEQAAIDCARVDGLLNSLIEPDPDPNDLYDLSCVSAYAARCAAGLDNSTSAADYVRHLDQGVERLDRALRAGYRNFANLFRDTDLDELRGSTAYLNLLRDLAGSELRDVERPIVQAGLERAVLLNQIAES